MKARLPQGYGGGPNNMAGLARQAQKMQEQMAQITEELNQTDYTAAAGGGAVDVTVNGSHEIKAIHIKPEVVDPEETDMLEDLLLAALNEAMRKADETAEREMGKITGGLNIPGMGGMF